MGGTVDALDRKPGATRRGQASVARARPPCARKARARQTWSGTPVAPPHEARPAGPPVDVGDDVLAAAAKARCKVEGGTFKRLAIARTESRLVRYCARPPFALDRIEGLADGRVAYLLKVPRRGRTTAS
jgi:hypothetical protein